MENENELLSAAAHVVAVSKEPVVESPNSGESISGHDEEIEVLQESIEQIDYSSYSRIDFATLFKDLSKIDDVRKADATLREIKPFLDDLRERERFEALKAFIGDGGNKEDFEQKHDAYDLLIDGSIKLIRDRKVKFQREAEAHRNENLARKKEVLNQLRELAEKEDSVAGFNLFKKLQNEWKNIGAVPPAEVKALWASYHALIDLFYDKRSISHELIDLDRRKNLEAKLELCGRAEKLSDTKNIGQAVKELNELHNDFKHIGPVTLEEKEPLWQRFKAASDAVYGRRDVHVKELNEKLKANLEVKQKLIDDMTALSSFTSDKIKDWNTKTQEALSLQKQWETSGGVAHNKSKDVNKKFWASFKAFFNSKGIFFKKLDEERQANLAKKRELIQRAVDLKSSEDSQKAINEVKDLQQTWKTIGPVPDKLRDKIFIEFKEACDYFFEQRRSSFEKADREQEENLARKEAICSTLEKMVEEKSTDSAMLKSLIEEFNNIGFVPKKSIATIRDRFNKLVQQTIYGSSLSEDGKERLNMEVSLMSLKHDPEAGQKIFHKEQVLRKRISKTENDLAVLRNNLEFFGRSKNAEKYKEEFNLKINDADVELKQLKAQLKMLKAAS